MGFIYIRGLSGLPATVKGATVLDANGDYNVYINIDISDGQRQSIVEHELRHIKLDHFYDYEPVIINELEAG